MEPTNIDARGKGPKGVAIGILAGICHICKVCPYAAKRPNSSFERLMRWHRNWCPAWAAHTKVYGEKSLSQ